MPAIAPRRIPAIIPRIVPRVIPSVPATIVPSATIIPRIVPTSIPSVSAIVPGRMPHIVITAFLIACPEGGIGSDVVIIKTLQLLCELEVFRIKGVQPHRVRIHPFLSAEIYNVALSGVAIQNLIFAFQAIVLLNGTIAAGIICLLLRNILLDSSILYLLLRNKVKIISLCHH